MVSVLAFYFDVMSSNPAGVYHFPVELYFKRTKINKKRPGLAHFLIQIIDMSYLPSPLILFNEIRSAFVGTGCDAAKLVQMGAIAYFRQVLPCFDAYVKGSTK